LRQGKVLTEPHDTCTITLFGVFSFSFLYYLSNNITCGFGTLQVTETLQAEGGKKKKK
jgi:hypothetical protein